MIDREKVIKGLECCTSGEGCTSDCPYFKEFPMTDGRCIRTSQADALAMLKERDSCENCAIAIEGRQLVVRCKDCIYCVKEPNGELYCDILAVGYEPLGSKKVNEDWFCADGERKD